MVVFGKPSIENVSWQKVVVELQSESLSRLELDCLRQSNIDQPYLHF
jgi:hypothetical protein